MSEKHEAFIRVETKCPICGADTVNRYVKSKLFTPVTVEEDHFVKTYKWEKPQFEHIRPNYYHIWYCPACHFADEKEVFRHEDDSGGKLEMIQDRLLIEARRPDSVLTQLSSMVDIEEDFFSFRTTLALHTLAIYIQEMLSNNLRQTGKLARFYLRTAWLYREIRYMKEANLPEPPGLDTFHQTILSVQEQEWPEAPNTEKDTIEKAIAYYKAELDHAGRVDDVKHEVVIMFLIAALYKQLQNKREAISYVRMIFQQCSKRRGSLKKAMDNAVRGTATGKQIETLKNLHQWVSNQLERASQESENLAEEIFLEEYPAAREAVLAMEPQPPDPKDVVELLRQKDFYEGTCRRVATLMSKNILERMEDPTQPLAPVEEAPEDTGGGFLSKIKKMLKK